MGKAHGCWGRRRRGREGRRRIRAELRGRRWPAEAEAASGRGVQELLSARIRGGGWLGAVRGWRRRAARVSKARARGACVRAGSGELGTVGVCKRPGGADLGLGVRARARALGGAARRRWDARRARWPQLWVAGQAAWRWQAAARVASEAWRGCLRAEEGKKRKKRS